MFDLQGDGNSQPTFNPQAAGNSTSLPALQPAQSFNSQPSLADHANTFFQMGLQAPMGSPERYQHIATGAALSQLHQQTQGENPQLQPDGFIVTDPTSGQDYKFPTSQAAQKAKEWLLNSQTAQSTGGFTTNLKDVGIGLLKGTNQVIGGVQGLAQDIGAGNGIQDHSQDPNNLGYGMESSNAAQSVGIFGAKALPFIAAGAATGGTADALGLTGLSGEAATGAALQGATGFATTQGNLESRSEAGALGAAGGAAAPYLSLAGDGLSSTISDAFSGNGDKEAVQTAFDTINQSNNTYKGIGQKLVSGVQQMTDENPNLVMKLTGQGNLLNRLSEVPGIGIDTLGKGGLTPADVQAISAKLNLIANNSNDKIASEIFALKNDLREAAKASFNDQSPGAGDQFESLFKTASTEYEQMKTVDDIFKPNANPSAKDANALINYLKNMSSSERLALNKTISDYYAATGIDLTNPVKVMSRVSVLKNPLVKKAGGLLLKTLGIGAGADLIKHL
jgi:hypothetical protein